MEHYEVIVDGLTIYIKANELDLTFSIMSYSYHRSPIAGPEKHCPTNPADRYNWEGSVWGSVAWKMARRICGC